MRKFLPPAFVFFILLLLLIQPARYFSSVQKGTLLFASSVLPSMLPYFFFTKVLTGTGCVASLASSVGKPVGRAYRSSPLVSYPLLMSLFSGYPVGARVLADLYENKMLTGEEARRAASFCSTSGSMFVLGSVGAAILQDAKAAVIILAAHYLGALLNGLLYRGKKKISSPCVLLSPQSENLLSEAMYQSVLSLALVGGFIAVSNLLGDVFFDLLTLVGLGNVITGKLPGAVLYSVFEVTRGCVEFAALGIKRIWTAAFCAFAVSFGGLSVILQSIAFLGKAGLKPLKFLLMKTTQAALSFALCLGLGAAFL